jgi:hypothetical protein
MGEGRPVKLVVLSHGISITQSSIVPLSSLEDPQSITDFSGFIFDPLVLNGGAISSLNFFRRQNELEQLVKLKDGIVICILRPNSIVNIVGAQYLNSYELLSKISPSVKLVQSAVRPGEGSQFSIVPNAGGVLAGYFRVLQKNVRFAAHLDSNASSVEQASGTVFAIDSVGLPLAVEFRIGGGRLCFVPPPHGVTGERIGAAFAQILDAHFSEASNIEAPEWVTEVTVPGANAFDPKIAELEAAREQISGEISKLNDKRELLISYRRLLFSTGRSLEHIVRVSLRLLGFQVPEPESYEGEWDVELRDPSSELTALGEVEGPEGAVDVHKSRQLLDYIESEALDERDHKGILIGNGFRTTPPDAEERRAQFTKHALKRAAMYDTCLLPTTELFKAICAVLESHEDTDLKKDIRASILRTMGIWTFAGQVIQSQSDDSDASA